MLQFGHDLSAVETPKRQLPSNGQREASIRPRPFSRGNTIRNSKRLIGYSGLQFGHDLSAVETSRQYGMIASVRLLQFGHDLSAVETCFFGVKYISS